MNEKQFLNEMAKIATIFPKPPFTQEKAQVYYEILKHIDFDIFQSRINNWLNIGRTFPLLVDLLS